MIVRPSTSELAMVDVLPMHRPQQMRKAAAHAGGAPFDDSGQPGSLWTTLDDRMRGRWVWAIVIGLILSAALAVAGFFSSGPKFRSVGAVRVAHQVPAILHRTDDHTQSDPDRFRSTQVQLMSNPRVLEQALADEEVARLNLGDRSQAMRKLREDLNVERDRESELIFVWYEADDPQTAQNVTNAVLRAYYDIYGRFNGQDVPGTLAELKDNEDRYHRELALLQIERRNIDTAYQTSDLLALQTANMESLAQLDSHLRAGRRELQRIERGLDDEGQLAADLAPHWQVLDQINPMLGRRRLEWSEAQIAFDNLKDHYLPGHSLYAAAKVKSERTRSQYDEEYQKTLEQWKSMGSTMVLPGAGARPWTVEDLDALQTEYNTLVEKQQQLVTDIARREDIVYQEQAIQKEIESIRDRVRTLEIEGKNLGTFISIAHFGAREDEPHENAQRKRAIMGAALGMMASFGGFFLLGTVDRRAFGASQLASRPGSCVPPCLGVLPDLGVRFADAESNDVASHCLHQIRNQIESIREPHSGYVLAVSSPFQGDGKTSIVMALGWSYAAAGFQTLLIDCDLVARSLTRHLGLTGREGMRDALLTRDINGSIHRMGVDSLSAAPAGLDATFGPENLRKADLEMLLRQVRDQYDIIIIDTGPMFGSLESTPVTAVADGVLLSVRRGRSRNRLEDCVRRLEMMGSRCIGVVLNCAYRSDCNRYVSETSLAAAEEERSVRRDTTGATLATTSVVARNALVRAVQQSTRVHPTTVNDVYHS